MINRCVALAYGIDEQLLADGWTQRQVDKGLRHHVETNSYLKHVAWDKSIRFNLNGKKACLVSDEDRAWAKLRLENRANENAPMTSRSAGESCEKDSVPRGLRDG